MNITLIKGIGNKENQQMMDIGVLLDSMKIEARGLPVSTLRQSLQATEQKAHNRYVDKVPKVIFAASFNKVDGEQVMENYNGVVLLEVNNLKDMEEAAVVRQSVAILPQTLAAFIGASGKSVKFLVNFSRPDGTLPQTKKEAEAFHAHAYRKAVRFYEELIAYKITLKRPSLELGCRFSYDPDLYTNPTAHLILQKQPSGMPTGTTYGESVQAECDPLMRLVPGHPLTGIISTLFESSLFAVYQEIGTFSEEGDLKPFLVTLATNCFNSGISEEDVVKGMLVHFNLKRREVELRLTIHNVYLSTKHFGGKPCISAEQLMFLKTDEFMKRRYEFRFNTQTTEVEYRERHSFFFDFRPVSLRVLNSIALNAQSEGLQLWDRDVKRYVYSDRISLFAPIEDYLSHLPTWDGKDRIRLLADSVPCNNLHWRDFFYRWFLCMVAHWRGMDKQHANSTSPLLIGKQGYMKSSFCLSILPPELHAYYTDSIDFGQKRDAELQLNRFALVNMDEFDQISSHHQGFLKHLLQKPVVNTRKPHQTAVQELRRYASFIATSNHYDLLTDPSGSRRFICIEVTGPIRLAPSINYSQLYAQALEEIQNGERYWFDSEEEAIVTAGNKVFEVLPPAEQLFMQYYRGAEADEECEKLLAVEIMEKVQKKSGFKLSSTKIAIFGRILRKLNIPFKRTNRGTYYSVVGC